MRAAYTQCAPPWKKSVTCNCGAAVRVGDDVIVVDSCKGEYMAAIPVSL